VIAQYLESTNLKTQYINKEKKMVATNWKDIRDLVQEANENKFLGVCTYLNWSYVVNKYASKDLKQIYVIGFYTGAESLIKRDLLYVERFPGDEFDIVFPLALYTVGSIQKVKTLLKKVRKVTEGKILKVIIETNILRQLPDYEIKFKEVIRISKEIGADFIKTNTGKFERKVPIEEDIKLIKKYTRLPIKVAGQIYTYDLAKKLLNMGIKRIGTSKALKILNEEKQCQKLGNIKEQKQ